MLDDDKALEDGGITPAELRSVSKEFLVNYQKSLWVEIRRLMRIEARVAYQLLIRRWLENR